VSTTLFRYRPCFVTDPYTDGTNNVYASQGNCGLLGTESGRKVGIYPGGDFSMAPLQP